MVVAGHHMLRPEIDIGHQLNAGYLLDVALIANSNAVRPEVARD